MSVSEVGGWGIVKCAVCSRKRKVLTGGGSKGSGELVVGDVVELVEDVVKDVREAFEVGGKCVGGEV